MAELRPHVFGGNKENGGLERLRLDSSLPPIGSDIYFARGALRHGYV